MAKKFLMTLEVAEARLGTFVSLLAGGEANIISITPVDPAATPEPRQKGYVGGKKNKGIRGEELAVQFIEKCADIVALSAVEEEFVAHGFAPASASGSLTAAVANGRIRRLGGGCYCRNGLALASGGVR